MKNSTRPFNRRKVNLLPFILLLALLAVSIAGSFQPASAQLSNEAWTKPVNLSLSGAANNPLMVVDSKGTIHVIWQDTFSGWVYTSGDGSQWSQPVPVNFPWTTPSALKKTDQPLIVPHLYADANGFVHALWMNEENILYYSKVNAKQFAISIAWSSRQRLAENAMGYDVALDATGRLHLAYIRSKESPDLPAGIYYESLAPKSDNWSLPVSLSQSPYFRTLTADTAHIKVDTSTTANGEQVYVAWDNPARERVYFTRSLDGKTWETPLEVDKPAEGGNAGGGPSDILIGASGDNVFLLWQANHVGTSCTQYYQTSSDGGANWSGRQRKPEDFLDCPDHSELMEIDQTSFLLFSVIKDRVLLQAWDGTKWSDPQPQDILTQFTDAETNRLVSFSCQQPTLLPGGNLLVVGCDKGTGKDIWWLKRQLVDVADWFPKEAIWNPVVNISSGKTNFLTPVMIAESSERVHAFWSQPAENDPKGTGVSIYYARWEKRQWSQPVVVLTSLPGKATQPSVAMDASGKLYVVWSGGQSGEIYFSQASANQAILASAWSKPQLLPSKQQVGSSPDMIVSRKGVIYVVYAIPLNEGRGIYLTFSEDQGASWSQPIPVFDGVAGGWAMVDQPRITITGDNDLHLIFTRYSLPSGTGSMGLYYTQSRDSGKTWSPLAVVVDKPVVWSEIIGFGNGVVNRLWQEVSSGRATTWHEVSRDDGATWARTAPVSIFGDTMGPPAIAWDPAGQLQLLQIVSRAGTSYVLQHWLWDNSTWSTERNLDLNLPPATEIDSLVGAASPEGHLMVLFSSNTIINGQAQETLYFADRSYQLPEVMPTSLPANTPTPKPVATQTPSPTATPEVLSSPTSGEVQQLPADPGGTGNAWVGSVLVPVAAGLIVLVAILIGVRMRQP